jgi:hypothetical protein
MRRVTATEVPWAQNAFVVRRAPFEFAFDERVVTSAAKAEGSESTPNTWTHGYDTCTRCTGCDQRAGSGNGSGASSIALFLAIGNRS